MLERYCVTCHNERLETGGLALDTLNPGNVSEDAEVWEQVVRKLLAGMMPPASRPRPDRATYEALRGWLETELDEAALVRPNPGRTQTFHLLSRTEYRNAIRDLLALDIDVESILPADDASYGFDNIAGVVKINQARMEQYLSAARKISSMAVGSSAVSTSRLFTVSPTMPQYDRVDGLPFGTRGGTLIRHNFPRDGEYVIGATLMCVNTRGGDEHCDGAGGFPEPHELEFLVDGEAVARFDLTPRPRVEKYTFSRRDLSVVVAEDERWEARVPVKAGPHSVGVTFVRQPAVDVVQRSYRLQFMKPYNYETASSGNQQITAPFVSRVTITGPTSAGAVGDTPSRRAVFACRPVGPDDETACATTILSALARRAYRRPATDVDVQDLMTFYEGIRLAGSRS